MPDLRFGEPGCEGHLPRSPSVKVSIHGSLLDEQAELYVNAESVFGDAA